jgi:hypothetical protein
MNASEHMYEHCMQRAWTRISWTDESATHGYRFSGRSRPVRKDPLVPRYRSMDEAGTALRTAASRRRHRAPGVGWLHTPARARTPVRRRGTRPWPGAAPRPRWRRSRRHTSRCSRPSSDHRGPSAGSRRPSSGSRWRLRGLFGVAARCRLPAARPTKRHPPPSGMSPSFFTFTCTRSPGLGCS